MNRLREKNTLVGEVAAELIQMIRSDRFPPGALLPPQRELAAELRVGASTMREAMQSLASMGLVESRSGKGTWVREDALDGVISPAEVKARLGELRAPLVFETRLVMEVGLTELAAARATPDDIDRIWAALRDMERAVAENGDGFVAADLEFHMAVAEASHNDLLKQFYQLSRRLLADVITELVRPAKVRQDALVLQRSIAEAIESHDAPGARRAALGHMAQIGILLKAYGEMDAEDEALLHSPMLSGLDVPEIERQGIN